MQFAARRYDHPGINADGLRDAGSRRSEPKATLIRVGQDRPRLSCSWICTAMVSSLGPAQAPSLTLQSPPASRSRPPVLSTKTPMPRKLRGPCMWPPHPGNPGRILLRKPGSQISSSKSFPVLRCGVFISRVIKRLTSDLRSRPSPCRTETAGAGKTLPPTGSPRLAAWPAGPSGARRAGAQRPRAPHGAHPAGRIPRGRFAGDLRGCVKVAGTTSWELGDRRPWPWWAGGRTPLPASLPGLSPACPRRQTR